jgi:serine/threonine protein phosphatase PrpC
MAWTVALGQSNGGRRLQEDAAGFGVDASGDYGYAIVADGLGGHDSGEVASAAAVAAAEMVWERERVAAHRVTPQAFIAEVIALSHQRVLTLNSEGKLDAKTTICCAVFTRDRVVVGNVGDSRIYLVEGRKIRRITRDHSVLEMLLAQGAIAESEVRGHPDANRLTQALGADEPPRPYFAEELVRPGGRMILCSDGLWQSLPDARLAELASGEPQAMADIAAEIGGPNGDNVTALVLRRDGSLGQQIRDWLKL